MTGPTAAAPAAGRAQRAALLGALLLDAVLPLALFYGLRLAGANQWLALVLSALTPLARVALQLVRHRRMERPALFTLSLMAVGTAIGMVTANPRLLLARESYITAVAGVWILATSLARHPLVFTATAQMMPAADARAWHRSWQDSPPFRSILRAINTAFGAAFLIDAAARVVMAYTLPVDLVPILSTLLLVVMLITVVQSGKAIGRRHLRP